jgi:hypothetical protein
VQDNIPMRALSYSSYQMYPTAHNTPTTMIIAPET